MTVYVKATAPCHLTVMSIDNAGKATVLFPNEFEPDNLISREPHAVPRTKSAYQFRLRQRGAENVVAVCQNGPKILAGTEPDYERQRFTSLGNFENFLRSSLELEQEERRTAAKTERPRPTKPPAKEGVSKDAKAEIKVDTKTEAARQDAASMQSARAAVRIAIE
jgi:Domain of unknown function (DUF4384)